MPRQQPGEPYNRLDLTEALELYGEDDTTVVDVRRPDEYAEGHVKGALFITVDNILERFAELPETGRLLFICAQGVRSGLACEMAAAMGIPADRLYNIEAGTGDWIAAGHPTSVGDEA
jgi:rhodanese-related sulfurtransferase